MAHKIAHMVLGFWLGSSLDKGVECNCRNSVPSLFEKMWKQFFGRKRRAILLENLALQLGGAKLTSLMYL
jgi:hypothetical protein